jgi:hypothetical protein
MTYTGYTRRQKDAKRQGTTYSRNRRPNVVVFIGDVRPSAVPALPATGFRD